VGINELDESGADRLDQAPRPSRRRRPHAEVVAPLVRTLVASEFITRPTTIAMVNDATFPTIAIKVPFRTASDSDFILCQFAANLSAIHPPMKRRRSARCCRATDPSGPSWP